MKPIFLRTLHTGLLTVLGAALLAAPAFAQPRRAYFEDNALSLRLGLVTPRGDGQYWDEKERDFTGSIDDFEDGAFGIEYLRHLAPHLALTVGGTFYEGAQRQAYRDFEDRFGNDITHVTTLDLSTLDVGLRFRLAPRHSPIVPYVGGGGTAILWRLEEDGEFIDFGGPVLEIFADVFEDDGTALGYFLVAGLEVPLGRSWSLYGEGRWRDAEDELSGDFDGFGTLDLSGRELAFGASFRF
jgi:opacity protein-like surface antigen